LILRLVAGVMGCWMKIDGVEYEAVAEVDGCKGCVALAELSRVLWGHEKKPLEETVCFKLGDRCSNENSVWRIVK